MLQELCPACGVEITAEARVCLACGRELGPFGAPRGEARLASGRRRFAYLAIAIALAGLLAIAFGTGWRLGMSMASAPAPTRAVPASATARDISPVPPVGRVLFASRLSDSLELESYRSHFGRDETIAWRAELSEPPPTPELTVVIAWYSIREEMVLARETVTMRDRQLTVIGRDEIALTELVPTAGVYTVTYFSGERKLAAGSFEVLPAER
jgi:hypothetical protein